MIDYVCDIDGTLADCEHRRQFVATKPKNWAAFNAGAKNDLPILPVLNIIKLIRADRDSRLIICSGRESIYRPATEIWLARYGIGYNALYMRATKDYRSDAVIKEELLAKMREDGYRPTVVFDDRKRVVDMWIRNGLFVFDVAQGKGDF
jgi:hypothetical protein